MAAAGVDEEVAQEDASLLPAPSSSSSPAPLRRALAAVAALAVAAGAIGLFDGTSSPAASAAPGSAGGSVFEPPAGAPLLRIDTDEVIAEFDPLSSMAGEAGVPGMPSGKDMDTSYLETAKGDSKESYWDGPWTTTSTEPGKTLLPHEMLGTAECGSNEELFTGLCYKKCSLLTNDTYPHRTSAWNCCRVNSILSCMLPSEVTFKASLGASGYDVDGNGGLPHPPGACLDNEENYLNMCYKTCHALTFGDYPVRSGPNTCCKAAPCWNIFNVKSLGAQCTGYNIGGGDGSLACPHQPAVESSTTPPVGR